MLAVTGHMPFACAWFPPRRRPLQPGVFLEGHCRSVWFPNESERTISGPGNFAPEEAPSLGALGS